MRERHKPDPEWTRGDSDTLSFVPSHFFDVSEVHSPMVMEVGRTPNGLVHIMFEDGARGRVSPARLRPLPPDEE